MSGMSGWFASQRFCRGSRAAAAPKIVGSGPRNNHSLAIAPMTSQQSWFGFFLSRGKVTWTRLVTPEVRGEFIKFREWKQQLSLKGRRLGTAGGCEKPP